MFFDYMVPAGSHIYRLDDAGWTPFQTTKRAVFSQYDRTTMPAEHRMPRGWNYIYFRLPRTARPYTMIAVRKES